MKQPKNTQFDKDILLDCTESDVFAEMADILIKGMKNHEAGNLVMDTTGADYFFVTYFVKFLLCVRLVGLHFAITAEFFLNI